MPEEFVSLYVVLLISTGSLFIFIGWFMFRFLCLNPNQATKTKGNLVCFRQYLSALQFGNNYKNYRNNSAGRVPVVTIKIDGGLYEISAASADYSLTESDIGRPVQVCYQRKLGIVLLIDNERSIRNYIRLKKTLFWCFFSVGMILATIGVLLLLLY